MGMTRSNYPSTNPLDMFGLIMMKEGIIFISML